MCVDTDSDPGNCGACGTICSSIQSCAEGVCTNLPPECSDAAGCPGENTDCQTRTCIDGRCGFTYQPAGFPTTVQTLGDCKQNVCDGEGGTTVQNDDADIFDSNDQCVIDYCSSGNPLAIFSPAGSSCATSSGNYCDGQGNCVECVQSPDCPDRPNSTSVCGGGFFCSIECNFGYMSCDPSSGNGCEVHLHSDPNNCGTCGNECPPGEECIFGACSGAPAPCSVPAHCPGIDTECQSRSCIDGECGISFHALGTPISLQTARDCQINVCDGAGGTTAIPDNEDVPVSTDDCLLGVCNNGVPAMNPIFPGTPCDQDGGSVCDGHGNCVECLEDFDPRVGASCGTGYLGVCQTGTLQCLDGQLQCVAAILPGTQVEICDGLDNDCDGVADNGFDFQTDVNNCGECDRVCQLNNATASCVSGQCVIASCAVGFFDCDGVVENGCETNINLDVLNCGGCNNICSPVNGTTSCEGGSCQIACDVGFANCEGNSANGCETNTSIDNNHCGGCNALCAYGQSCVDGVCQ
jgi:hypothetical protein